MFDIRDHGGSFGGGGEKIPPLNKEAVVQKMATALVTDVLPNGEIYGMSQSAYLNYPTYYHNDKDGNLIRSFDWATSGRRVVGWNRKGYFVFFNKNISILNPSNDQIIEQIEIPSLTNEVIRASKVGDLWVIVEAPNYYDNYLRIFNSSGVLLSSWRGPRDYRPYLMLTPWETLMAQEAYNNNGSVYTSLVLVSKDGTVDTSMGDNDHTYQNLGSGAILATLVKWQIAFLTHRK